MSNLLCLIDIQLFRMIAQCDSKNRVLSPKGAKPVRLARRVGLALREIGGRGTQRPRSYDLRWGRQ
jgi:hypothetical protein